MGSCCKNEFDLVNLMTHLHRLLVCCGEQLGRFGIESQIKYRSSRPAHIQGLDWALSVTHQIIQKHSTIACRNSNELQQMNKQKSEVALGSLST